MSSPAKNSHIIGKAGKAAYRIFLQWAEEDDKHQECVHVAHFQLAGKGSVEAYVKIYPFENGRNRGLINEVTGYLWAHALQVPQPAMAFIAEIPLEHLPDLPACRWLSALKNKRDTYPAFCTQRLDGRSAAVRVPAIELELIKEEIRDWKDLPHAVALDENIAHTDRHLNNLIRLGKRNFAVIDNGRLANTTTPSWTKKTLNPISLYRNRLSEHLWAHKPPEAHVSRMLDMARRHPAAFDSIRDELEYWFSRLITVQSDRTLFLEFLEERTMHIDGLLRSRYNRLI